MNLRKTSKHTPHDRHTCLQPLAQSSFSVWVTSYGFVQLSEKVFPSCSLSNIRHSQVPQKHPNTCQFTAGGWRIDHIKTLLAVWRSAEYCIFILKYWKNKAWMIKNELCNIMRYDEIIKRLAECYNLLDILHPVPSSSVYCRTRNHQFRKTLWQSMTRQNYSVIQSWH